MCLFEVRLGKGLNVQAVVGWFWVDFARGSFFAVLLWQPTGRKSKQGRCSKKDNSTLLGSLAYPDWQRRIQEAKCLADERWQELERKQEENARPGQIWDLFRTYATLKVH